MKLFASEQERRRILDARIRRVVLEQHKDASQRDINKIIENYRSAIYDINKRIDDSALQRITKLSTIVLHLDYLQIAIENHFKHRALTSKTTDKETLEYFDSTQSAGNFPRFGG